MKFVIFDMDGVIIDSEPYYSDLYEVLFDRLEISVTKEEKDSFVGCSTRRVWTYLKEKYRLTPAVEELMQLETDGVYEFIQTVGKLMPIEGIPELLKALKQKGIKASIASSSDRRFIEYIIGKLDLKQYFDCIISGDEVANGKPAPDIFLEVVKKYGSTSSDYLVIEDSANGVAAAKTAGMKCVGYRNWNSGNQDISMADIIIERFDERNIKAILELLETSLTNK